ncbi:hypothetical protein ANCCAN_00630 [Ancylostoma caninum]|uniref:3-hydroxyisobutyrate dehydrogenase n=1 Tax=Ancylostoma caninum TaxID=29170 RepID=A0A368H902_ANCCA|nr:hypothetical protein ANCCAN_00630 [Ancylostoma caninum]
MQPGTLCIDSSTIDQTASIEVAGWCQQKQSKYVDAPVSGGVTGAQNATLTFMVGSGKCQKTFDRAASLIKLMGKNMDLSLAQNASTTTQSPTPLGSLAHQIYRLLAQDPRYSTKDFGIVYQFLKDQK